MSKKSLNICYLGPFDPNYPRNRVLIRGLIENGINVTVCNRSSSNRLVDYAFLLKDCINSRFDVIILGARGDYYGQPLVPLLKKFSRKPIIFDSVITLYETQVLDRNLFSKNDVRSILFYLLDRIALSAADLVFSDTNTHAKYYSHLYNLDPNKIVKLPISSDDDFFHPMKTSDNEKSFIVLFWGGFIPLQGVKYIIHAAKLLECYSDIKFELMGIGQNYVDAVKLSKSLNVSNIIFNPKWVPYNDLPKFIAKADICLGIFGETEKAKHVIPNKAIESLAMKKPLITGDSPAARELLKNRENCILVPMANPTKIAEAILILKNDEELRKKIAENGYNLFVNNLSPKAIGEQLYLSLSRLGIS